MFYSRGLGHNAECSSQVHLKKLLILINIVIKNGHHMSHLLVTPLHIFLINETNLLKL